MARVVVVVQARMNSSRFPGKVLRRLPGNVSLVDSIFRRLQITRTPSQVIFAIPNDQENLPLYAHLQEIGAEVYLGSLNDVQSRFLECGVEQNADWLVRITGDCPLVDPSLVDVIVTEAINGDYDYFSNVFPATMPDGLDIEVFKLAALQKSSLIDQSKNSKEHVTPHLRESGFFKVGNYELDFDLSSERWTVDYPSDLEELNRFLPPSFISMSWQEIRAAGFRGIVATKAKRNEGSEMSEGQKLWSRAKAVIPGGSMLLSKRPEMFLPDSWPAYYSKASGITVTDLDQKTYLDFATMSVGACSLGYGNEVVDRAVIEAVGSGVMSTLNSPGEVRLAEKLVELHPWASMVRLARTGGEANAIAIRIARAHTGRDKVAICGYHGWHDWYLSANLGENSNLDGHLLPGLDPAGVPRQLTGTTVPFGYNDIESLESLLQTGDFAAVQMEVSRNFGPAEGFLQKVRDLCDHFGVVLIFDECTSGFRETFGGLHLKYGVDPDIAMFGKALGNGYAITAVVGRLAVMESAQSTFISSTFWTERLGPEAALATIFEMERVRSWEILPEKGKMIKEIWKQELDALGLDFQISGIDALPTFALKARNWLTLKTLFIQEMLDKGFLSTGGFYSSTAHDNASIDSYRAAFAESMSLVASNMDDSRARSHLRGPIAHAGFARLN